MGGGVALAGRERDPRDRSGRPAEQQRQRVLDDGDLLFDFGDRGGGQRPVGDDPIQLEPVRDAALQPVPEIGDRFVVEAQRPARDFELQVELAKQEVVRRDIADEGDEHAAAALIARQHDREGGLVLAADATEQVQFPGQLKAVDPALVAWCPRRRNPLSFEAFDA